MKFFNNKGFTLIELMVSVGIFALMTALLLFRADRFDGGIVLENLAYDIALSIREAQTYGLNVLEAPVGTAGEFEVAYGAQFKVGTQYIFYADLNNSRSYDIESGTGAEHIRKYSLKRGATISNICIGADENTCTTNPAALDVLFLRPNPKALITGDSNYGQITLTARDGSTRIVGVRKTGQIFVK